MGLIQNGFRDSHGCLKFAGSGFLNGAYPASHHANFHQTGRNRNLFAGEGITDDKVSVPIGYRPPYSWIMAQKAGGMGSTGGKISGRGGTVTVNLAGGLNAESAITGQGGVSDASMGLIMSAVANLTGTASCTGSMVGSLSASATLSGTSSMSAPLGAIAGLQAGLQGTGGVCCSTFTGQGWMSCDIAPATTTAASVIANAVWDAAAVGMEAGSMGEAVLAAGGGLVPPTAEENAAAVRAELAPELLDISFMIKIIKNKRTVEKEGDSWLLVVYDDDDVTPILAKHLGDKDASEISDLASGVLAREGRSSV